MSKSLIQNPCEAAPVITKSSFQSQPKVLFIGDSVGKIINAHDVELSQKCRVRTEFAEGTQKHLHHKRRYQNVVDHHLKNPGRENYDFLVLSAPTNDVTNAAYDEDTEQAVIDSSHNVFNIAQKALNENPYLKKVIVMEHHPRFDSKTNIKLASIANNTLNHLRAISPLKERILIGKHSLHSYGVGLTHEYRYQDKRTGKYDGVHLYGPTGQKDFTNSVKSIFLVNLSDWDSNVLQPELGNNNENPSQWKNVGRKHAANHTQRVHISPTIHTQNRFQSLSQGN